jgi:hypothetical protein
MIRLYFDWNIFVQLRNGKLPELATILAENPHRFFIFYSTSHIGDIYKSYNKEKGITQDIEEDLAFLSKLTANKCFIYDKVVRSDVRDTKELFDDRITTEGWGQDLFVNMLEGTGDLAAIFNPLLQALSEIPLTNMDAATAANLEQSFPDTKNDPTHKGLFTSLIKYFKNVNTSEQHKDLRSGFQKGFGFNKDVMYHSPDPAGELDKMITEKLGPEKNLDTWIKDILAVHKKKDCWFDHVSTLYILLDMTGYKEDKIKVTDRKKETFKNTIEDSFHTAFASQCDFYITLDNRNHYKAVETYKKLEINTKVMEPAVFVDFITDYVKKETEADPANRAIEYIKDYEPHVSKSESGYTVFTYFIADFILDYFNKIIYMFGEGDLAADNSWRIVLSKVKPTNGRFTLIEELNLLVAKLIHEYSIPLGNKLTLTEEESVKLQHEHNWPGREWKVSEVTIILQCINGFNQLYIYPTSQVSS